MSLFDDLFGGGKQAAAKRLKKGQQRAMEEYQNTWNEEKGYLNPQLGGAFGNQDAMTAMLDPNQFYSNIMSGYEMSPAAQREMASQEEAMRNAAAAGGMSGSSDLAQQSAQYAGQFTSDDMQRYFQNQMGIFGQGMGVGQNMASYRDLLGQRMGQGQIGKSQADAMQALGRASGLQSGAAFLFGSDLFPQAGGQQRGQGQAGQAGGQGNKTGALMSLAKAMGFFA